MATSKELLTNLADELRTLTNTTDKMGLSVMAEHVSDANTEVDEQSAVVDELMAALQGKSVPGEEGSLKTHHVTINVPDSAYCSVYLPYGGTQRFIMNGTVSDPFTIEAGIWADYYHMFTDYVTIYTLEADVYENTLITFAVTDGAEISNITAPEGCIVQLENTQSYPSLKIGAVVVKADGEITATFA